MITENKPKWAQLYASIPKPVTTAFYACVIAGFLVHLFAFTNIIPNSDGLSRIYGAQQMTISGRWFLHYASIFHGFIQAPALIGVLSLLFMGIAAGMTVDLLSIRSPAYAGLWGCLMAVFPPIAYNYLYMFTASAYGFGCLLAVSAVWIYRRHKWGLLPAGLLLACSIGTYQAYLAVAVSLGLICVIRDLLDSSRSTSVIVKDGFRMLAMYALGAILYVAILWIFLQVKDLSLLNYRGIGSAGQPQSLVMLLRSILSACKHTLFYFLVPYEVSYATLPLTVAHWFFALCGAFALTRRLLGRKKLSIDRTLLLFAGILMLPLALNLTQVLTNMSPNMRYSMVFAYLLPIVLMDGTALSDRRLFRPVKPVFACCAAVVILVSAQICNLAYVSSATAHRAAQTFAGNLVSRVEQTPGYRSDMEVVVIGSFPRSVYHSSVEEFELVEHYSCMADTVLDLNKHIYYYLNDWLNVPWQEPEEQTMIDVSESEMFRSMPLYPSDGSVRISDGRVIVKLAPTYTPRRPYEIEYENRR